jgi:very-short-patch-repair endonuclease
MRAGVLLTKDLRQAGIDSSRTRSLVRGQVLRPVLRGAYCLGHPPGPRQRAVAAALVCHPEAVASFESAALLLRWRDGWESEETHLWLPPGATRGQERPLVRLHWSLVLPHDVEQVDGVGVTSPARLARDSLRFRPRNAAVALLDQGLRTGGLRPEVLAEVARTVPSLRQSWAELTDPRAESPLETHVRLILRDAGLIPDLQVEVRFSDGRHAGRIDLGWRRWRVGIECDGREPHEATSALFRDRRRQDDLESLGWLLVRVTWRDVWDDPAGIVRRVRRKLALREAA